MKEMELLHICRPSTRRSMKISTHIWAMCLLLHFQWPIKTKLSCPENFIRVISFEMPPLNHDANKSKTRQKKGAFKKNY